MTEPFAWFRYQQGSRVYYDSKKWDDCQPLYTTPPQRTWVDLTDEEIQVVAKQARSKDHAVTLTNKLLREKNT